MSWLKLRYFSRDFPSRRYTNNFWKLNGKITEASLIRSAYIIVQRNVPFRDFIRDLRVFNSKRGKRNGEDDREAARITTAISSTSHSSLVEEPSSSRRELASPPRYSLQEIPKLVSTIDRFFNSEKKTNHNHFFLDRSSWDIQWIQ